MIITKKNSQQNLLTKLNKEQIAAVTHTSGPLLIVAGAGTGKTTVITRRIAYLVQENLAKPDEILALTFTEKAAGEMQERADLLLPLGYYEMWIMTFHSFCQQILKNHALDIGLPNDFTLLDETAQWILIYKNLNSFNLDYYKPLGNPAKFIDALCQHFSRCKDEVVAPEDYLKYAEDLRLATDVVETVVVKTGSKKTKSGGRLKPAPTEQPSNAEEIKRVEELANAFQTYQKLLIDNNYLDFGDLINFCLELFKKRPKILKYYQDKFKYIMVDEFQDTNYAQYQLVKLLAGEKQNLTVVGDDDQSIYKFRGASISNILKFQEDYPKLKQITLLENYRSSQNILDLAYGFIKANNPDRLEEKLHINKKLNANFQESGIIEVIEGDDLSQELNGVAKKILEIKNLNQSSSPDSSWNNFAILIRSNKAANELLPILENFNIPYTFLANRGLYKKPIILEILAYLKLLENCLESGYFYKALNFPKFKILHHEQAALLHFAHKKALSAYEAAKLCLLTSEINISLESKIKLKKLLEYLDMHGQMAKHLNVTEIFVIILRDLGFEEIIKAETLENSENRELIDQFYKIIENFSQKETDKSLHNFLLQLELQQQAGDIGSIKFDPNKGPESLKILTIHSAKGLEFENVFIINLVDQRFPTREKSETIELPNALIKDILPEGDFHLQEERRLFYVAITRAKKRLYLSWAKDYGGARTKKPSIFLQETKLVPSQNISKATGKVFFEQKIKHPVVYTAPITQFSFSQLSDFETCPLKYKYQHYLKIPTRGSCHLSFGQTIHKVFEEYLNIYKIQSSTKGLDLFGQKANLDLPEFKVLEKLYEKVWIDDWYINQNEKEEFRNFGKKMLQTFYNGLREKKPQIKFIEKFFKLKIGKFNFVGKIDRADLDKEGIAILDYKTGKVPKKTEKKDLDQLYIYQWAAQEFLKEKVSSLYYWYLKDNQIITENLASTEEINLLKSRLLELMEKISYVTKFDLFEQEHAKAKEHKCEFS